jgi:hypothetical protein
MSEETRHQDKRFSRMMLCVAKITKQSQTADCFVFPRCCISGCSDGTGRQHTSSRVGLRWLTSTYRSAHENSRPSPEVPALQPDHLEADSRRAPAAVRCKLPGRLKAQRKAGLETDSFEERRRTRRLTTSLYLKIRAIIWV